MLHDGDTNIYNFYSLLLDHSIYHYVLSFVSCYRDFCTNFRVLTEIQSVQINKQKNYSSFMLMWWLNFFNQKYSVNLCALDCAQATSGSPEPLCVWNRKLGNDKNLPMLHISTTTPRLPVSLSSLFKISCDYIHWEV